MFTDAHNHLINGDFSALLPRAPIFVNAARRADWEILLAAANAIPTIFPFYGLHPWYAAPTDVWLSALEKIIAENRGGIGEIGLDKPTLRSHEQVTNFYAQMNLAKRYERPVSVHNVGALAQLAEIIFPEFSTVKILMHGFGGEACARNNAAPLKKFLDGKVYFSFAATTLRPLSAAAQTVFKNLPPERLLLETDAPARFSLNDLPKIYAYAAKLRAWSVEQTAHQIADNAAQFIA